MVGHLEGDKCPWMDRMCGAFIGVGTLRTRQRSKALKSGRLLLWAAILPSGNGRRGSGSGAVDSGSVRCSQRAIATRERFATRTRPFPPTSVGMARVKDDDFLVRWVASAITFGSRQ